MAYKTGDKFVIEIDSVMTNKKGNLYGIKGFKTLTFGDYGLEQLERIPGENKFRVGDEISSIAGSGVITRINGASDTSEVSILWGDGSCGTREFCTFLKSYSKTGRHFDEVETLLQKMRGEQDE